MAAEGLFGCGIHRIDRVPFEFQNELACPVCAGKIRDEKALTDEDVRALDRATKVLNALGWFLTFTCPHERCRVNYDTLIVKRSELTTGGFILECGHQVVRAVGYKSTSKKPRGR